MPRFEINYKIILINRANGTITYICTNCGQKMTENRAWCPRCNKHFEDEEVFYKDEN